MDTLRRPSPVGELLLAANGQGLAGLWLAGQRHYAAGLAAPADGEKNAVLRAAAQWLDDYFSGLRPDPFAIPLAPAGTPFQQAVWALLRRIPYGETTTYGELARALRGAGLSASPRAVGGAVGRNPISILIPCHRVLGAGGRLTGYAGGLDNKRLLLDHEGAPLRKE